MDQLIKQWLSFQKMALDNTFQSMAQLQDYMAKQITLAVQMNPALPEEGKRLISEWVGSYRKGREELKSRVDDHYRKAESYFDGKTG